MLLLVLNMCVGTASANGHAHHSFVSGSPEGLFYPDNTLSRAEMAVMLSNYIGDAVVDKTDLVFQDVPEGAWYYEAVMRLSYLSLLTGHTDGYYHPDDPISRGDFVVVLIRYITSQNDHIFDFPPVEEPLELTDLHEHWNPSLLEDAVKKGLVHGNPDNTFRPNDPISRAEAVVLLNRLRGCSCDNLSEDDSPLFDDLQKNHWAYKDICDAATAH